MRVCGKIAGHFFPRVRHEAGVGRVVAALREVAAQAGLEDSAGVVLGVALFVGAATGSVAGGDEFEYVFGERVEWDHQKGGERWSQKGWRADATTIQKKAMVSKRLVRRCNHNPKKNPKKAACCVSAWFCLRLQVPAHLLSRVHECSKGE